MKKVKAGLNDLSTIKIPGLWKLVLRDNVTHCPPLEDAGERVEAETITEAFFKFERAMGWMNFDTLYLNEFSYPGTPANS